MVILNMMNGCPASVEMLVKYEKYVFAKEDAETSSQN